MHQTSQEPLIILSKPHLKSTRKLRLMSKPALLPMDKPDSQPLLPPLPNSGLNSAQPPPSRNRLPTWTLLSLLITNSSQLSRLKSTASTSEPPPQLPTPSLRVPSVTATSASSPTSRSLSRLPSRHRLPRNSRSASPNPTAAPLTAMLSRHGPRTRLRLTLKNWSSQPIQGVFGPPKTALPRPRLLSRRLSWRRRPPSRMLPTPRGTRRSVVKLPWEP